MGSQRLLISDQASQQRAARIIASLPLDKPLEVLIKPFKPQRSLDQLRLYWAWMGEIARFLRDTAGLDVNDDDIHGYMKGKFLSKDIVVIGGDKVRTAKSTKKLSVEEMSEYMQRIDHYAAESLGLVLEVKNG